MEKCKCGEKATINLQKNWVLFRLNDKDFFEQEKMFGTADNEFWCEKCAEIEGLI